MGSLSIWHILIVAGAALLLFGGKGKISDFMGDFGRGINSFKKGLSESDADKQCESEMRDQAQRTDASRTVAGEIPAAPISVVR